MYKNQRVFKSFVILCSFTWQLPHPRPNKCYLCSLIQRASRNSNSIESNEQSRQHKWSKKKWAEREVDATNTNSSWTKNNIVKKTKLSCLELGKSVKKHCQAANNCVVIWTRATHSKVHVKMMWILSYKWGWMSLSGEKSNSLIIKIIFILDIIQVQKWTENFLSGWV